MAHDWVFYGGQGLITISNVKKSPLTLRAMFVLFNFKLYILNSLTHQLHFQFGDTSSKYLGQVCVSRSWIPCQGHGSKKAVACNSTHRKLLGLDRNICYDNAHSNLTFWPWPLTLRHIFIIPALSFEYQHKMTDDKDRLAVRQPKIPTFAMQVFVHCRATMSTQPSIPRGE